jgi:hypothetical protein
LNGSRTTLTNFYSNNRSTGRGLVVNFQKATGTTTATVNVMVIDGASLGWPSASTSTACYDKGLVFSHA